MLEGPTSETPKLVNSSEKTNFKIEHFPNLDVVLNLDHPSGLARKDIIEALHKVGPDEKDFLEALEIISSGNFFVKIKGSQQRHVDFLKGGVVHDPMNPKYSHDFDKRARYARIGILNEILLSNRVRKIINSKEAQDLAKEYGFAGIQFAEPVAALVYRSENSRSERSGKYVVYRHIEESKRVSPEKFLEEGDKFVNSLREILSKNGISPNDLFKRQLMVTEKNDQQHLVLIDIEAYGSIQEVIDAVTTIEQEIVPYGNGPAISQISTILHDLRSDKYTTDPDRALEEAYRIFESVSSKT